MKTKAMILLFFVCVMGWSQDINQFDAEGKRHGVWKKNFEGTDQLRYEGELDHGKEMGLFKFYILVKKKSVLSATKLFKAKDDRDEMKFLKARGKTISEGKMVGKTYVGKGRYYHKNSDKKMKIETYDDNGLQQGERLVEL